MPPPIWLASLAKPRFYAVMIKSPWNRGKPPRRAVDWPATFFIGGVVVAAAILVGVFLSGLMVH